MKIMSGTFAAIAGVVVLAGGVVAQSKPPANEKVDVVAVAGCLKEASPDTWTLVNAGDPVVSTANAPSKKEIESIATSGKNEYRLIGVSIFNLPAHRGHTVLIKGLHVKASPMSRVNVTSVTMVSSDCPAK
jgi:hypothetical protein